MNPRTSLDRRVGIAATLVGAAALSRLLPHWPNFTAVPAMALLGGVALGRRWQAFALPLLAMLVSDLLLAVFVYGWRGFATTPSVYAAIALTTWIGTWARRNSTSLVLGAVAGTAVFFVLVNFHVWLLSAQTGGIYPPTAAGLAACYAAALPFAANMLASTLVYGLALFALYQFAVRRLRVPVAS